MAARIQGGAWGTAAGYPLQRRDRSLDLSIGVHPEASRDDDNIFGAWAIDLWPGWASGWIGAPGWQGMGDPVMDFPPNFVPACWAMDIRWSGSHQTPYTIKGRALDGNGAPLAGASVELWAVYNPPSPGGLTPGVYPSMPGGSPKILIATTTTDALGNYAFGVADNTTKYRVIVDTGAAIGGTAPTVVGS